MRIIRDYFRRESENYDKDKTSHEDDFQGGRIRKIGRRGWLIAGVLAAVVIAFGCWLVHDGIEAKSNLEDARGAAQEAREALLKGNSEATRRWVEEAESHAQRAYDVTHSLPWKVAAGVPWLGSPFETGRQISNVVLGLATDVLRPSADVARALSPDKLLEGGHVDVSLLGEAAPRLSDISADAARLGDEARAISEPTYVATIRDARQALQRQTGDLTDLLHNTALAARLVPSMLGADGPRTYFMAFQTNAEARGTGGLLGGFGILRFDKGAPVVASLGPNTELNKAFTPVDLGPGYPSQYASANPASDWRNSNLSAHFPYAAEIWKSMWAQQSGDTVDGVIGVDPVAVSYILDAVGPVTMPDGQSITADNVVELTESTVYDRFPLDQVARKQYLQDVASEVVKKITGKVNSPRKLLSALGKAVSEGRIALWSASQADQKLLETTPLAHSVPDDSAPYAQVVINNLGGNKLDYYLRRKIEYSADACEGQLRNSTVTVVLTNTAPPQGLPDYVAASGRFDADYPVKAPSGTNVTSVALLATKSAQLVGAISNGRKAIVFPGTDRGHPLYEMQLTIEPGQTVELKFLLKEPPAAGAPRVPVQPLIDNVFPVVSVPECSN